MGLAGHFDMAIDRDLVKAVFKDLVSDLPPGCASLEFSTDELTGHVLVKLSPTRPGAASIEARVTGDLIYLFFGRGAVFEVPESGRYTSCSYLEEIRLLCSGVIAGKLRERVSIKGSKVVGAQSVIHLGERRPWAIWRDVIAFFRLGRGRKEVWEYQPYCEAQHPQDSAPRPPSTGC